MGAGGSGAASQALEQALRTCEAALVAAGLAGRHANPGGEPEHLRALRREVLRQAEALPSACWPRAKCGHCHGEREVTAMHAQHRARSSPEFAPGRRLCPRCRGTGLPLALRRPEPTTPLRVPAPAPSKQVDLPPDWPRWKHVEDP